MESKTDAPKRQRLRQVSPERIAKVYAALAALTPGLTVHLRTDGSVEFRADRHAASIDADEPNEWDEVFRNDADPTWDDWNRANIKPDDGCEPWPSEQKGERRVLQRPPTLRTNR